MPHRAGATPFVASHYYIPLHTTAWGAIYSFVRAIFGERGLICKQCPRTTHFSRREYLGIESARNAESAVRPLMAHARMCDASRRRFARARAMLLFHQDIWTDMAINMTNFLSLNAVRWVMRAAAASAARCLTAIQLARKQPKMMARAT